MSVVLSLIYFKETAIDVKDNPGTISTFATVSVVSPPPGKEPFSIKTIYICYYFRRLEKKLLQAFLVLENASANRGWDVLPGDSIKQI